MPRLPPSAGVAPFNHDSGQFRGQRHIFEAGSQSPLGPLYGRPCRSRHNPILRPLYLRLLDRGKAKKTRPHRSHAKAHRPHQTTCSNTLNLPLRSKTVC